MTPTRKLAGWPVYEDPDEKTIRRLRKRGFTGLVVFTKNGGSLPWGVWNLGLLCVNRKTEEEAEKEIVKIAGRNY